MKILLAMPTWTDDLGGFTKIGKTRNPQVALGLLYLATLAEERGHQVEFVDCDVENVSISALTERVVRNGYDLVGLTATSPIFHKAVVAAERIKAAAPQARTIVGGDHVSIFKREVFFDAFDFAVFGEAEETWPELLDLMASGADDYSACDGLLWRRGGEVIENKPRRLFPDLNKLPLPAIHLTQIDKYRLTFALPKYRKTGPYVSIMMTRGCPFKCSYCSESSAVKYGGELMPVRFRSPKHIVDEIEHHYRKHDIRHFFFMDSNITLKKRHTVEMCEEIIARKLPITFEGWTRANLINDDLMALLAKAGMIRMSIGIESGDPEILKIIKKEVPHEAILNAFMLMEKYGIEPACSAMLGNPGETKESVKRTIEFIDRIPQVLYTNFSIANPYPGTEMLKWAKEGLYGMRLRTNEDGEVRYARYDDSPIEVNDLTAQDLVRWQAIGLIKLHLKPKRMVAAVRMLGIELLVPVFFKMLFKALSKVPDALGMLVPRNRLNRLFHP